MRGGGDSMAVIDPRCPRTLTWPESRARARVKRGERGYRGGGQMGEEEGAEGEGSRGGEGVTVSLGHDSDIRACQRH